MRIEFYKVQPNAILFGATYYSGGEVIVGRVDEGEGEDERDIVINMDRQIEFYFGIFTIAIAF